MLEKIAILNSFKQWLALVVAVTQYTGCNFYQLLKHSGQSSAELSKQRRLLLWAYMETVDCDQEIALVWFERMQALKHRSILAALDGPPPEGLEIVLNMYTKLVRIIGEEDVVDAIRLGLLNGAQKRGKGWSLQLLHKLTSLSTNTI